MYLRKLIETLQEIEKNNPEPNLEVMVTLSDCEIISTLSYAEINYARPDDRTGLYCEVEWDQDEEKPKDPRAEKIVMIGYDF